MGWSKFTEKYGNRLFLIIAALLICWLYLPIILQPNKFIGNEAIGFSSNTAALYHIQFDSSYNHFQGQNYPYGEHILYSGLAPILTNKIKYVQEHLFEISSYATALLNLFLLISILFCSWLLFAIFRQLQVDFTYASLASLGITLLSPQLLQISSEYWLSCVFVIPLILYLLLRFHQQRNIFWSIIIGVSVLVTSLMHINYLSILVLLICLYFIFETFDAWWMQRISMPHIINNLLHWSTQVIAPIILFSGWTAVTDSTKDRPEQSLGIANYSVKWLGIISAKHSYFWQLVEKYISNITTVLTIEQQSYLGLAAILLLFISLIKPMLQPSSLPIFSYYKQPSERWVAVIFWGGITSLILAFGFPFVFIKGINIPVFEHINNIGRWAWVSFYTLNIALFYNLYKWRLRFRRKAAQWVVSLPFFIILGIEVFSFQKEKMLTLFPLPTEQYASERTKWLQHFNPQEYQAILPIPYFHVGSEHLDKTAEGEQVQKSLAAGLNLGLPCMGTYLQRTSLTQTLKLLQFVNDPTTLPSVIADLPNDKPLLVLMNKQTEPSLLSGYHFLLQEAKLIYEDDLFGFYRLNIAAISDAFKSKKLQIIHEFDKRNLRNVNGILTSDSTSFFYENYDSLQAEHSFLGHGAFTCTTTSGNDCFIWEGAPMGNGASLLSFWVYLQMDGVGLRNICITEIDRDEKNVQTQCSSINKHLKAIDNKGWGLVEIPIIPFQKKNTLKVVLEHSNNASAIYIDELILRAQLNDIYKKSGNLLMKNNRWFRIN
ncbi:MAG: hypothetical protein KA974_07820 [Saprospiraceae bacterium]|nr:hypothetical protein [Saprospiraceae bacterium]